MNKYNADNTAIIDASGKEWAVEIPHLLPLPEGIEQDKKPENCPDLAFGSASISWTATRFSMDTHWLARKHLPPVPKPKTQAERDQDAAEKYAKEGWASTFQSIAAVAFLAGADYARKEAK